MRPRNMDPAGHAGTILPERSPLISVEIPWPVRSALIFAHPEATLASVQMMDSETAVAVTVDEDKLVHWWLILKEDEKTWGVSEIERT
jgi:hypothetical protein